MVRRTTQLTLTIANEVMEKYYEFREQTSGTLLLTLPRATLISYILDWALSQKNLEEGVIKLVKEKYPKTYGAWYKDWIKRKF